MHSRRNLLFGAIIFLSTHLLCATSLYAQQKKIKFEGARSLKNLKVGDKEYVRYIGDAKFFYDNTRMLCDSAYLDPKENSFDAYGNVVIIQEDTRIYGDKLHFEGSSSQGVLTGREVKLVDDEATLVTDILYFNSKTSYVYYNTGGIINTKDSKLTSQRGYYDKNKSNFAFAGNVEMINTDGTVFTDSLEYNSKSELASFFGPTHLYNKDNYVYCEKGWYNRKLQQSNFQLSAYILSGSQKLFGDNIFYDRANGYARAIDNVVVVDTVNKSYAYGDKANYWDKSREAEITENPYVMLVDKADTLFLRSDKLFLHNIKVDAAKSADSTYKQMKAISNVRFYRKDIQGVCDSMIFSTLDSTLTMHVSPVMWNENNQMSANLIKIFMEKEAIRQMDFEGSAFVASMEAPEKFNQVAGKSIIARFANGQLNKMDVLGNGQTVYYVKDKDTITMVNRAESANLTVNIMNKKVSRIIFRNKPITNLYPLDKVEPEDLILKGFNWQDKLRPVSKYSVIPESLILFPVEKGNPTRIVIQPNTDAIIQ